MSALLVETPMAAVSDVRKRSRRKVTSPVLVSGFAGAIADSKVSSCQMVPSVAQLRLTSRGVSAIVVASMGFMSIMTGTVVMQFLAISA